MPKDIITTPEQKFSDELKSELKDAKSARFAVGWFFISGLQEIRDELDKLEKVELLISPSTNRQTVETMLAVDKFDEAVRDKLAESKYLTPEQKQKILDSEANALLSRTGKLKPSKESAEFLIWLREKLSTKQIQIHMYTKEAMHAKMYLIEKKDTKKVAFVGSSNISVSGFSLNTELNIRLTKEEQVIKLEKWFKGKWENTKDCDFTSLAEKALKNSWAENKEVTPFLIYLRVLHDIFSLEDEDEMEMEKLNEDMPELYKFQKDAVIDAYKRLKKYGGLFLADVPGLGKTYMGSALLAHLQEEGERGVIICPPKIKDQWEEVLDEFNVNAKVISRGKLSDIIDDERLLQKEVIIVDEAHYFRNSETNGYKDLQIICEGKKVVLIGATPQNLSLWDIYQQLKLFHPQEVTEQLKVDPPILKEFFEEAIKEREDLDKKGKEDIPDRSENLFQQLLIRRTRKNIIDEYGTKGLPEFPKRQGPYRIDYDIDEVYPGGIYSELNKRMDEINFARYDIGSYIKEDEFTDEEKQRLKAAGKNLRKIMHMILFKLLESSVEALRQSTDLIYNSHLLFLKGLDEGKVLAGESADKTYKKLKDDVSIEDIDIPQDAYDAQKFDKEKIRKDIEKDMAIFKEMYEMVKDISPGDDNKLQTLVDRIKGEYVQEHWDESGKEKCEGKKVLIFTQYASTAKYIGEELKKHFSNVDFVSGVEGKVLTKAALFSPKANEKILRKRGLKVTEENKIDILVSTELLGEGMNLQDGQVVINYELHWNPVRIIQRVGRIDRIGSEHKKIWVYNFFPQTQADEKIHVKAKIEKRMKEIHLRFGGDEKTVNQDEVLHDKKFYKMYSEDERSLEEDERDSLSAHHRLNWVKLKESHLADYQKALTLPNMVGCGKLNNEKGVMAYCRTDNFYKLLIGNIRGEITNRNDWEILSMLECGQGDKPLTVHDYHYDTMNKLKEKFEEEANINEEKKSRYLELVKKQTINKLGKMKTRKSQKIKDRIDEVEGMVRSCKLDVRSRRNLRAIIRQKHGLRDEEILQEIVDLLKNCEKEEYKKPEKKYAEIIISESLK